MMMMTKTRTRLSLRRSFRGMIWGTATLSREPASIKELVRWLNDCCLVVLDMEEEGRKSCQNPRGA